MQWEYRTAEIAWREATSVLNTLGREGWELVTFQQVGARFYAVFKRPTRR
jgi:hypothetical protein